MTTPLHTAIGSDTRQASALGVSAVSFESSHDGSVWAVLAAAKDAQQFCQSWLAIQCRLIPAVEGGLVLLLVDADGSYAPAAVWPDVRQDMSYLTQAAQKALSERRGVVLPMVAEGALVDCNS